MAGVIPENPRKQFLYTTADSVSPLAQGRVYTYLAGTTTPAVTYQDANLEVANSNPIILDARGECVIYGSPIAYKFVVQNRLGETIYTQDYVISNFSSVVDAALAIAVAQVEAAGQVFVDAASDHAEDAEVSRIAAESAASAAAASEAAADSDRIQTGLDAVATAADRVQTGLDAAAASAASASTANGVYYPNPNTLATLNANLAFAEGFGARLLADPTPANNGYYVKVGASGVGSWSYIGAEPVATETADRIAADTAIVDSINYTKTLTYGPGAVAGTASNNQNTRGLRMTLAEAGLVGDDGILLAFSVHIAVSGAGNLIAKIVKRESDLHYTSIASVTVAGASVGVVDFAPDDFGLTDNKVEDDWELCIFSQATTGPQVSCITGNGWLIANNLTGSNVSVSASTLIPCISASIKHKSVFAAIDETNNAIAEVYETTGELVPERTGVYGAAEPLVTGTAGSSTSTRFFSSGYTEDIEVNRIDIFSTSSGSGKFKTATPSGADMTIAQDISFTCASGLNTFRAPTDFTAFTLTAGQVIGWKGSTALVATQTGVSGVTRGVIGDPASGATVTTTASSLIQQMTVSNETYNTLQDQITDLGSEINSISTNSTMARALLDERYTSSSGLILVGASIGAGGLVSGTSSNWDSFNYRPSYGYSTISKKTATLWGSMTASNQQVGIAFKPIDLLVGTGIIVDGSDNTLKSYLWTGASSAGTADASAAIPWTVNGSSWKLEAKKERLKDTYTLTNVVTQQSVQIINDVAASDPDDGRQFGLPGVVFPSTSSGGVVISRFMMVPDVPSPRPSAAKKIIAGDSIVEGSALGVDFDDAWTYLLEDAREAALGVRDLVVAGRGGDESTNFLGRLNELLSLCNSDTEFWIAIGTNDTSQATWRTNIATAIARIRTKTQHIRQVALVPKSGGGAAVRNLINADIVANYFDLPLPPIRMDLAVSDGNDGETWNPTYNLDGTHPNAIAGPVMLAQVLIDAPESLQ